MAQRSILVDENSEQLSLFSLLAEDEPDEVKTEDEETVEITAHKRIRPKKEKHLDYSYLPHKEIIHKAENVKYSNCGNDCL